MSARPLGSPPARLGPDPDRVVREAAAHICASLDPGETLRAIADAARRALRADRATCYVIAPERAVVEAIYTTEDDPKRRAYLTDSIGKGVAELPIWRALLGGPEPLFAIEDVSAAPGIPPLVAARLGSGAFLGVRLEHGSIAAAGRARLLGALFCSYRVPRYLGEEERSIALGLANLASLALANARLHAQTLASLAEAERRATTDPLTGLANRRGIEGRLDAEVAEAHRHGRRLAAIAVDLDRFKAVNDRHGHAVGDDCLRAVARTIEAALRPHDLAGRIGGEEFLVLLPDTGSRGAFLVAERLRRLIAALPCADGTRVSASLGVAAFPRHAQAGGELLRAADAALYEAKAAGRDRTVVYSPARARVRSRESRRAQAGRDAFLGSVLALARALDARDPYTATHSETVARYGAAIAERLGMDGDRIEEVRIAGLLHDIGKVGVSDAVLKKPGALDAAEWAEMRRHPEIGANLLTHPDLAEVRTWVLHHHERPDGGGYPEGLRAGATPLEALVLGVADAYEAMTADRPYRRALSPDAARAELVAGRGSQFEPAVVDAFLGWLAERVHASTAPAPPGEQGVVAASP